MTITELTRVGVVRDILETIREPSEDVIEAAATAVRDNGEGPLSHTMRAVLVAAIDKLLTEEATPTPPAHP